MMTDWQTLDSAPKDRMIEVFCPGACEPTRGVLQGIWNDRLKAWTLNPYGTTQFTVLYPSRWRDIGPPPVKPQAQAPEVDAVVEPAKP